MRKFLAIILIFLCSLSGIAQKLRSFKDHCGLYYKSMEDLYHQKTAELSFYHFQPGQVIASVGVQCCNWEAAFAATTDSLHFYLEDH